MTTRSERLVRFSVDVAVACVKTAFLLNVGALFYYLWHWNEDAATLVAHDVGILGLLLIARNLHRRLRAFETGVQSIKVGVELVPVRNPEPAPPLGPNPERPN